MSHVLKTREVCTGFWWGDLKETDHLERPWPTYRSIILKLIFKTWDVEAWTGRIWFRIGTRGGLL